MLSSFPRDVLDEIWDLIGSISEGFHTYFCSSASIRSCFKMYDFDEIHLFNNSVLFVMFKIFHVHFYRLMAIFMVCYMPLLVSVTIITQWYKMLKKYYSAPPLPPGTNPANYIN